VLIRHRTAARSTLDTVDDPIVALPERIELELDEVRIVLTGLDEGLDALPHDAEGRRTVLLAVRPLTQRLWRDWATCWMRSRAMHNDTTDRLTAPETARRLGIDTLDVYALVFEACWTGDPTTRAGSASALIPSSATSRRGTQRRRGPETRRPTGA
jgi:hypothetical protein